MMQIIVDGGDSFDITYDQEIFPANATKGG
jgi:hypothetical protein